MACSTAAATQRICSTLTRRSAAVTLPSVPLRCCSMCARPRGTSVSLTQPVAAAVAASSWSPPRPDSFVSIEAAAPGMPQAAPSTESNLRRSPNAFAGSSHWRHAAALRSTVVAAPTGFSSAAHFVPATATAAPAGAARSFSSSAAAAAAAAAASSSSPPPPPPSPSLDTIHLSGLEFFSYHGVYPEETRAGQPFRIDMELSADLSRPARTDQLDDTINYAAVFSRVAAIMTGPRLHKLLESLALRIIDDLLDTFPTLHCVQIKLTKPKVAIPGILDFAGVTIRRTREQRAQARQQQSDRSAPSSST